VIVALPGATPVIVPSAATVAIEDALVVKVSAVEAPASPVMVTVGRLIAPTVSASVGGALRLRTTGVTVTVVLPLTLPAVAVIVAVPPPVAVSVAFAPLALTATIAGLLDVHAIVADAPLGASVAPTFDVAPTPVSATELGETLTDVTDGRGGVPPSPPPPQAARRAVVDASSDRRNATANCGAE
jgi:hypothetical protein